MTMPWPVASPLSKKMFLGVGGWGRGCKRHVAVTVGVLSTVWEVRNLHE
jgi:hypothetical protein